MNGKRVWVIYSLLSLSLALNIGVIFSLIYFWSKEVRFGERGERFHESFNRIRWQGRGVEKRLKGSFNKFCDKIGIKGGEREKFLKSVDEWFVIRDRFKERVWDKKQQLYEAIYNEEWDKVEKVATEINQIYFEFLKQKLKIIGEQRKILPLEVFKKYIKVIEKFEGERFIPYCPCMYLKGDLGI